LKNEFMRLFRGPRLRFIILSSLCLITLSSISIFWGAAAKVKVGKLPKNSIANHQLQTIDGRQFSLAGLRGKVVVLNFFAVWCGHSKQHIQTLTRLDSEQDGLQIIGLAVECPESTPERLAQFINEFKITYPVAIVKDRVFSKYVESRDVSVPQTLIYGRDGRLAAHFAGHDSKVDAELTATVKRELEKP
jgi:thiol-disulfide isomerase/thioredoxin